MCVGARVPPADCLAQADGVLAGQALADLVLAQVDPTLKARSPRALRLRRADAAGQATWSVLDGGRLKRGDKFGVITGSGALRHACVATQADVAGHAAHTILVAERIVLNFMQRMSGIATLTAAMAAAAAPARMLETRKTAPGLRLLDKWAVRIGGGENHRMGLYDMVMIKDNHIAAAGGITAAVTRTAEYLRAHGLVGMPVEVEASTLDDVREALRCCPGEGAGDAAVVTRIMLDNMDVETMRTAVALVGGRAETEASGNVTLATVPSIAATGVTFISSGALTHSVAALDISLNIEGEWGKTISLQ
jgi:nicotinate-nucleotide pyrophosphorylase (carboxylating)